jgi:hypothetical protein
MSAKREKVKPQNTRNTQKKEKRDIPKDGVGYVMRQYSENHGLDRVGQPDN